MKDFTRSLGFGEIHDRGVSRRLFLGGAAGASAAVALAPWPARAALVKTESSAQVGSVEAVRGLVARNFPGREDAFDFTLVPREGDRDHFELSTGGDQVKIVGSSALALASGLHWYLKYYADRHWSWCGANWDLPATLPEIDARERIESPYLHNGYFNYCTYNYTMSWWDWPRWERELDYMALSGVTLPLFIVGAESVWLNFLLRLGYSRDEAKEFICGPAYFAWWLMGNLEGFGGPLPDSWLDSHLELGQKILARMREFGMAPMLQGFVGLVPTTLPDRLPAAHVIPQGKWCGDFQRPAVLDPTDPLFPELAQIWYQELNQLFGQTRYFAGDLFHEGGRTEGVNVAAAARAVYRAMTAASPDAVWVLQGWGGNPKPAILAGLEPGQALILDLCCERNPAWPTRNSWGGHPWVWNTIVNFGGNPGVYGQMPVEAKDPVWLLDHPGLAKNLTGIGTTPEAIDQNPVVWDLHFEMFWRRQAPDLTQWLQNYARRRYGRQNPHADAAWQILLETAYNAGRKGAQTSIICSRVANLANLKKLSPWRSASATYDHARFHQAVRLMHAAAAELAGRDAFDYDLVDVTRQLLSNLAFPIADRMRTAFFKKDRAGFATWSDRMVELILDLDALLATRREFMLGAWIADARAWGRTPDEKDLYELNARTLVTTWTYRQGQLNDYSRREWSGLLKDYYLPRWQACIDHHAARLTGQPAPAPNFFDDIEQPFTQKRDPYPSEPLGPPAPKAEELFLKYRARLEDEKIYGAF